MLRSGQNLNLSVVAKAWRSQKVKIQPNGSSVMEKMSAAREKRVDDSNLDYSDEGVATDSEKETWNEVLGGDVIVEVIVAIIDTSEGLIVVIVIIVLPMSSFMHMTTGYLLIGDGGETFSCLCSFSFCR
ncbi:hypothetical protein HELRODRAFT_162391 [Helobdella robusta]|uniref:Uncharacterized protein n=1 Tax=Helobdella robusta TaxID=6412 RepID=T1ESL4_HELRO|nr:hypothetical protein HELRODRAFT_162391 [Helobdella robusta]ESN98922.1 hypothetical protein HELRODRAFT_162391 [Helobdella robusta]